MLDFGRFQWLSFDCYGTLVDWEAGISSAVGRVLDSHGVHRSRAEMLELFAEIEPRVQRSQSYLEYRFVLRRVMETIGGELEIRFSESDLDCLAETLPTWPVFPEVKAALDTLRTRYKLAVISNVDDDMFAGTVQALNIDFDAVVTAEQSRSYKPNLRNFNLASSQDGGRGGGVASRRGKPVP